MRADEDDRHDPGRLSPDRAFVVQLRGRTGGAFSGRVEHVTSGEAAHFESAEELLAFLTQGRDRGQRS